MPARPLRQRSLGQALVEFTLVFPLAILIMFAVVVFGLYVFYLQEITNVAREAARFASIHSSQARCPTSSWRDPQAPGFNYSQYPFHCDGPNRPGDPYPWPRMTEHARSRAWGLDASKVHINACWSGYARAGTVIGSPPDYSAASGFPRSDEPAVEGGVPNVFAPCTINRIDPVNQTSSLGCQTRMTSPADDPASDKPGNQVTVYACFQWTPPLAGVLAIPAQVTIRAVVTEVIQRQQ